MTTIRAFVEKAYPDADGSHFWMPEYGDDNIECANCAVRPYNEDAKIPCSVLIRRLGEILPDVDCDYQFHGILITAGRPCPSCIERAEVASPF